MARLVIFLCFAWTLPCIVRCAKEGDKGDGWVVKSYTSKVQDGQLYKTLYCEYDGTFRFRPNTVRSCNADGKSIKRYLTSNSLTCSNTGVTLQKYTSSRRQKYQVKQVKQKNSVEPLYTIEEDKGAGCDKIHLACPDKMEEVDFDYSLPPPEISPISLELSSNPKWLWSIDQDEFVNYSAPVEDSDTLEIDCLNVVLRSVNQKAAITANAECTEIEYDYMAEIIAKWVMEPARGQQSSS